MIQYKHQRALLIAGIVAIVYILFLRWGEFSTQSTDEGKTTTKITTQDPTDSIPAPKSAIPDSNVSDNVTENARAADRYVKIRTDVMEITLDLQGGDLVESRLLNYQTSLTDQQPMALFTQGQRNYIVASGFTGQDGVDTQQQRATYTTTAQEYRLTPNDDQLEVVLTHQADDALTVRKILRFERGSYAIQQTFAVSNNSNTTKIMAVYSHIKRGLFGDPGGGSAGFGASSYLGAAISTPEDSYQKITFDDIQDTDLNTRTVGGWVAMLQHYFVTALIPPQQQSSRFYTLFSNQQAIFGHRSELFSIAPNTEYTLDTTIYSGPKIKDRLLQVQENLPLTIDYGWFWFISEILMWLLIKLQTFFINWGVSIIMLTVIVRLLFFWPTKKAFESMARMRLAMPKIEAIKNRVGDDKQAMSREVMAFYKKEKLNPLGGCLPMLLQMPVFIALYWGLLESVELRHADFMLWINDLSASDSYFVLPILMGLTFFIQQRLNPQMATMDPMMKQVMQWMPLVFTFLFLWLPSGLVLYFVTSNSWSIIQQYIITKQIEKQQQTAAI